MIKANSKFNRTDQRQFIDEIYIVNKKKEFNATFIESTKAAVSYNDLEKALQHKRKAYNYLIANTFKEYDICPDDLYTHLDNKWSETYINEYAEWITSKCTIEPPFILPDPLIIKKINPLSIIRLITYQYSFRTKWEGYKAAVLLYAEKYSSEMLENEK